MHTETGLTIGLGYRRELAPWIDSRPPEIGCLEILAEHFSNGTEGRLRDLADKYPLFVHSVKLSPGTPGPLDADMLDHLAHIVETADPLWISEHVAFTHTEEVDLGHLNPIRPIPDNVSLVADHAREIAERCGKPIILENITSHLRLNGTLSEPEFLNRLCEAADCGLLLDVTNLFINSRNHGFDPLAWLGDLDISRVVQLHLVGYSYDKGRWQDRHAEAIQEDLFDLTREVFARASGLQAVIIERDWNYPHVSELSDELRKLRELWAASAQPNMKGAPGSVAPRLDSTK